MDSVVEPGRTHDGRINMAASTTGQQSTQFLVSRTARGRMRISEITEPGAKQNFRLLKTSGESYLEDLGYDVGDIMDELLFNEFEFQGHLYPAIGSVSGASLDLPHKARRSLERRGHLLNVTNRIQANRLGWRQDVTGIRRCGQAKARELAFAESTEELYVRVYNKNSGTMVTYHLLDTAISILLEKGVMVGDHVDPDLQFNLIQRGHLYTLSSGQTGF